VPSQDFIDLDEEAARLAKKNLTDQASLTTDRVSDNQSSVPSDQRWRGKTSAETLSDRGDDNDDAIDMSRALADSAESSAVDLGSEPVIDLPFPGSGSSVSSGSRSKTGRSSARRRRLDNSHVDLLAGPSDQASSRLADGSGLRSDAGSPSAQPVDVVNIRASNWLTGSLVGGLTGLAVCLGVWLSGALSGPKSPASSNNVEAPPPVDPLVVAVRTVLEQAQLDPSDPAGAVTQLLKAKSNAENAVEQAIGDRQALEASRRAVQDQLTEATNRADRLTEEKRAVDTALAEVRAEMQTQENERRRLTEELKAAKAKVAAGTTSAPPPPPAVGTDRAELAKLQDAVNAWQTKSTELERELAATQRANDALKQSLRDVGSFVVAVRHRLQTAPEARPSEILTALDTALAARASADVSRPLPVLAPSFRADRAFHRGLSAYRAGASADAERELTRAVGGHPYDARIWYFLGLAQLELGQSEKAEASFRQAVHLERQNQPASDEIDVLFERLPPETRRLLDDIRRRG
jgi:tetratricopeptide (TPR) repeat protein